MYVFKCIKLSNNLIQMRITDLLSHIQNELSNLI